MEISSNTVIDENYWCLIYLDLYWNKEYKIIKKILEENILKKKQLMEIEKMFLRDKLLKKEILNIKQYLIKNNIIENKKNILKSLIYTKIFSNQRIKDNLNKKITKFLFKQNLVTNKIKKVNKKEKKEFLLKSLNFLVYKIWIDFVKNNILDKKIYQKDLMWNLLQNYIFFNFLNEFEITFNNNKIWSSLNFLKISEISILRIKNLLLKIFNVIKEVDDIFLIDTEKIENIYKKNIKIFEYIFWTVLKKEYWFKKRKKYDKKKWLNEKIYIDWEFNVKIFFYLLKKYLNNEIKRYVVLLNILYLFSKKEIIWKNDLNKWIWNFIDFIFDKKYYFSYKEKNNFQKSEKLLFDNYFNFKILKNCFLKINNIWFFNINKKIDSNKKFIKCLNIKNNSKQWLKIWNNKLNSFNDYLNLLIQIDKIVWWKFHLSVKQFRKFVIKK